MSYKCCCGCGDNQHSSKKFIFYIVAICLGILCGLSEISLLQDIGKFCSEMFIRIFGCVSMPIISLSVIVALSNYGSERSMNRVWKKTLKYTITTTIAATVVSAILYTLISPPNVGMNFSIENSPEKIVHANYVKYLLEIIPESITGAFAEHKVLSVMLISAIIGISIRYIGDNQAKNSVRSFFVGIHSIFFTIIKFIVKVLPIGLFGFITVCTVELQDSMNVYGMWKYFVVIILANIIQGVIILPLWLMTKKINPIKVFKAMFPALSIAFFSKSSSGALPISLEVAETKLGIQKEISRFVLPLCTTINMNGCAAFIFTTIIYVMQNYGVQITPTVILTWILVSTIAAVGNAGIPMGCIFLSASLLSSMDIPMPLIGMILPIYGVIDMFETGVNVWSDYCITSAVGKRFERERISDVF